MSRRQKKKEKRRRKQLRYKKSRNQRITIENNTENDVENTVEMKDVESNSAVDQSPNIVKESAEKPEAEKKPLLNNSEQNKQENNEETKLVERLVQIQTNLDKEITTDQTVQSIESTQPNSVPQNSEFNEPKIQSLDREKIMKRRKNHYKFLNEDIDGEYTSFSSINQIVEKVPLTFFEKDFQFSDEELERFYNTPGLFLFQQLPEKWSRIKVKMWLYLYGFSFLQKSFFAANIDGDQFLFLTNEEVKQLCPEIT